MRLSIYLLLTVFLLTVPGSAQHPPTSLWEALGEIEQSAPPKPPQKSPPTKTTPPKELKVEEPSETEKAARLRLLTRPRMTRPVQKCGGGGGSDGCGGGSSARSTPEMIREAVAQAKFMLMNSNNKDTFLTRASEFAERASPGTIHKIMSELTYVSQREWNLVSGWDYPAKGGCRYDPKVDFRDAAVSAKSFNARICFSLDTLSRHSPAALFSEVAALMADAGLIVLTAFISPFRSERDAARRLL
ncbi:MAG: adenylyl-sulfate kinase, partial [Bdellovibrionia bacterium]